MNVCSYCLNEATTDKCESCMIGTMLPVIVFLEGCNLEELVAEREHWANLPDKYRPDPLTHAEKLKRFDAWIERVKKSQSELVVAR